MNERHSPCAELASHDTSLISYKSLCVLAFGQLFGVLLVYTYTQRIQNTSVCLLHLLAAGLAALAAALAGSHQQTAAGAHPPLIQLLLGGNPDLSDTAISKLAAALTATPADTDSQQQQQQQWHLDVAETGAGSEAVKALAGVLGLQLLSLFGCKLGTGADGAGERAVALRSHIVWNHL